MTGAQSPLTAELDLRSPAGEWQAGLASVLSAPSATRPVISVPAGGTDIVAERVASLVTAGYSLRRDATGAPVLEPAPSGILYIAEWMAMSGPAQGTLDWFRQISGSHFRRYLISTSLGDSRTFAECADLADEAWKPANRDAVPQFVMDFIATRGIDVVHIVNARLGFDLIPALKLAYPAVQVVVQFEHQELDEDVHIPYVTSRYDNLIDAYTVTDHGLALQVRDHWVSPRKIHVIVEPTGDAHRALYGALVASAGIPGG